MPEPIKTSCVDAFVSFVTAMRRGELIKRVSASDKEFHFQNWVGARLDEGGLQHDSAGRNSYPDFTLVHYPDGYEVKGLKWPGRVLTFDSNSQIPTGEHNSRSVYYVFGRYPSGSNDDEYPVVDLVVCHGDFLNADRSYVHENKSFRGFGSYGDLQIRDRKMYVAPTPFALTDGTTGQATLIVPSDLDLDGRLKKVGELVRTEAEEIVIGYTFDLRSNELVPDLAANPGAGREHRFGAYWLSESGRGEVSMKTSGQIAIQLLHGEGE